ncbi:hypothetical protein AWH62_13885 [Maricaulis sp. W15]|uniref:hypothetical protein n=1 Tax=Maricaulis sp. W15 TaxID=1772333 RepID=UPI000948B88E|nr:hypothetical protein [Maricaulis sp. W15]OLF80808.1 hypothetical protein AWH62_13885 [Maricaulis sp. W15]
MSAKYASLHAGLLARKGEASPAIPSPLGPTSYTDQPQRRDIDPPRPENQPREQQCHNTPLFARKRPPLPADAAPPPRHAPDTGSGTPGQQASETPASASPPGGCCSGAAPPNPPRPLPGPDAPLEHRTAVRLTAEQKRRLGTVSVQMSWSQQRILAIALDEWLDRLCETGMKNCACLKTRKPG